MLKIKFGERSCRFGKGTFYTMEAAIASVMMVIAIVFFLQRPPETLELSRANYKLKVYDALQIVEDTGDLRKGTLDKKPWDIEDELALYIPSFLDYNVTIYNKTDNLTEIPEIDADNILTVNYFIAGRVGNYSGREIRVFVWGFA